MGRVPSSEGEERDSESYQAVSESVYCEVWTDLYVLNFLEHIAVGIGGQQSDFECGLLVDCYFKAEFVYPNISEF